MQTPASFVALAIALPLIAQGHPATIRPVAAAATVSHCSSLQATTDGEDLIGVGDRYRMRFRGDGVLYEPALGTSAPVTQHLLLSQPVVTRGGSQVRIRAEVAPMRKDLVASYARAEGIEERFDVQPDGVELSWTFAERPAGVGDLVVRYAVDTSLGEPSVQDGGLSFQREFGGVHLGKVSGVDGSGRRVAGTMQWDGSGVRFVLPAGFVDTAVYPIVLDPLVGTTVLITAGFVDVDPDAAFDSTDQHWMIVWSRVFSATDQDPMSVLINTFSNTLIGFRDLDPDVSETSAPHVADLGVRDRFGVVFTKHTFTPFQTFSLEFRAVDAAFGVVTTIAPLEVATLTTFDHADVGVECGAPIGTPRGFVIVWEQSSSGASGIFAKRIYYDALDSLTVQGSFPVFQSTPLAGGFSQPAIARAAGPDGKLLVVAKDLNGTASAIVATVLDSSSNVLGATTTVASSPANALAFPDVDGYGGNWVVAYEAPGGGLVSGPAVHVRPVSLDFAANALAVGNVGMSFGGFPTNQAFRPSVGYALGRTWLGYKSVGSVIGGGTQTSLKVAALNSGTCAFCNEQFVASTQDGRVVVATMVSGGVHAFPAPEEEDALYVMNVPTPLRLDAQRLRDYGNGGTMAGLGGGCSSGTPVVPFFFHQPGIGSNSFTCGVTPLSPTALLPIFNLTVPAGTIPCGACEWTPFGVTVTPPISGGAASVRFPIPCQPSLVGEQFEVQWTVIDLAQAPCPVFPGFVLSDRTLLTIGN